jgi:biotin operon repressor
MKSSIRNQYYTINGDAKELGITRAAVHRAIKQGRLEVEHGEIIKIIRTKTKGWKISQPSLNSSYRVSLLHQWVGMGLSPWM